MATTVVEPEVEAKSKARARRVAGPQAGTAGALVSLNLSSLEASPVETYHCGFDGAAFGIFVGVVFFIAGVSNASESATSFGFGIMGAVLAGAFLWKIFTIPYEVRTEGDSVEFISFTETKKVKAAEIRVIVRHVDTESGSLHHMEISFGGSRPGVTLYANSESLFRALTRLNPKAFVSTVDYVPPDPD
jgi:hypothetical protein